MKTHLEVQQREYIRRDLAERMKFVPPDLRVGESVFYWQEDPNKIQQRRKSGTWLKVEIFGVQGSIAVVSTCESIFQANVNKLTRPLDTVDQQEFPDSRERTGAPVLWPSCEGQMDVFGNCSKTILTWIPSLIGNYCWLQPNRPQNQEGCRAYHHSYCRAFVQNSRKSGRRLLWCRPWR